MIDPLFGKYCYIDTPWIAGKHTIYRIIRSGVRSNSWCEVPVNGRTEKVNHGEHSEEIVFVMLDTLIDEDTKIMRFALKDVEIIEMADRNCSEIPNNSLDKDTNVRSKDCETCKWGEWYRKGYDITMMDDECGGCCSWNNKWTPKTEPQSNILLDAMAKAFGIEDEPQTEVETMSCEECKHYRIGKPCEPFLNELDCRYEPQTDCAWKGEES